MATALDFVVWDPGTAAPATGLTPTWSTLKVAASGADVPVLDRPSISELSGGLYRTDVNAAWTGWIACGTSPETYAFVPPEDGSTVVPARDSSGAPLAGLTLTWEAYVDQETGTPISPQATFVPLGSGLYRIDGIDEEAVGVLDLTSSAEPRYPAMLGAAGSGLVVAQDPVSGTTIEATDSIEVTLTSEAASITIAALFASWGEESEVVWDSLTADFAPLYRGASSLDRSNPQEWVFTLRRRGGWPGGKTVSIGVVAADVAGNSVP